MRVRIEVDGAGGGAIVYLDPAEALARLSGRQQAGLRRIADEAVTELANRAGHSEAWAEDVLLSELVRRWSDEQAYEREAERRGVLAL